MRAGCSGWRPGLVLQRRGMLQEDGGGRHRRITYLGVHRVHAQVAVVGAGAAGLYTALCAARQGAAVTLVSAMPLAGSSSYWAQGGLAAALAEGDSPEIHLADTIAAGRGSVRDSAARVLCDEAPAAVRDLQELGLAFDADRQGQLALGLEGGHSRRRIVHAGGAATGRRIIRELSALAAQDERIAVLEGLRATRILPWTGRAAGVLLDDGTVIAAPAVVLATGGAAAMWSRTTNPAGATGGGLLLAYEAGAQLADLELMQFHPTAVAAANGADGFLVTEAVRGEGAHLLDVAGRALRRRAGAPRRGGAGRPGADRRQRRGVGGARHAPRRPGTVPQRRRGAQAGRHRSRDRARAGRARGALHDGRASPPTCTAGPRCPACSPSASARAPACTAPTGWPPTR